MNKPKRMMREPEHEDFDAACLTLCRFETRIIMEGNRMTEADAIALKAAIATLHRVLRNHPAGSFAECVKRSHIDPSLMHRVWKFLMDIQQGMKDTGISEF